MWYIPVLLDHLIKNSGTNIVSHSVADGKCWKLVLATLKLILKALLSNIKVNDFLLSMNQFAEYGKCTHGIYQELYVMARFELNKSLLKMLVQYLFLKMLFYKRSKKQQHSSKGNRKVWGRWEAAVIVITIPEWNYYLYITVYSYFVHSPFLATR